MPSIGTDVSVWIALTAGILSFFSPCVLPLIPSYLTYITGLSFGQLQEAHPGARVRLIVVAHSLTFILGFSVVFITLGGIVGLASANFQEHLRSGLVWVERLGGLLIILFGIHLTGLFHFGVLLGEKRVHLHDKPAGFFGTFIVGLAFAAGWTPCIGPILASILMIAATSGQAGRGLWLLTVYSVGLGIPFLIAGLLFHQFLGFFQNFRRHIRLTEIFTGALLVAVGLLLLFGKLGWLTTQLYQWLPMQG
ncbi:MAG: cytochrome c biogenesis protein CcdA [Deltaproteobacteria bacterium]|nr:MAG: cytochrome c biogenesis protein CcdA [Deltaproteobacteria bacterium]